MRKTEKMFGVVRESEEILRDTHTAHLLESSESKHKSCDRPRASLALTEMFMRLLCNW